MLELWPTALAVLVERFTGYPKALFNAIGHPVQWMGALIAWLDETLNTMPHVTVGVSPATAKGPHPPRKGSAPSPRRRDRTHRFVASPWRSWHGEAVTDEVPLLLPATPPCSPAEGRVRGCLALLLLLACTAVPAWMLSDVLSRSVGGWVLDAIVATAFIAQKSMRDHVRDVAHALSSSVASGRDAVAKIVGRETRDLDESGVAKAALESLAENTADGIIAPVFWYALLGLPGLVAYKAINTADSMIGHRSERHMHFGFAAAKLDDLVNLPGSRLTALLFAAAACINNLQAGRNALRAAWRDAGNHRSPNAGWPEAAMAGALGLRFGGPRNYDGEKMDLPYMGDGRDRLSRTDIDAGLKLYERALWIILALLAGLAIIL